MHKNSTLEFTRKEISPKDAKITKLQVWHSTYYIWGFKFYNNDKVVLEAGHFSYGEIEEVNLEAGERLVGVKYELFDNPRDFKTYHCNLVLVIGKLE